MIDTEGGERTLERRQNGNWMPNRKESGTGSLSRSEPPKTGDLTRQYNCRVFFFCRGSTRDYLLVQAVAIGQQDRNLQDQVMDLENQSTRAGDVIAVLQPQRNLL